MSELMTHQVAAIDHLKEWKVGALFMEAGTGKTRVAIELINKLPDADLVVWIAPLRLITAEEGSIKEEISKWGGFPCDSCYYGIESISASNRIYLELRTKIESYRNPVLIIDESLKIKNSDAKRTRRLLELSNIVEYKFILNGTPLSKSLMDLYPQMQFLSPKILNMQELEFKNTFCKYTTITKSIGNYRCYKREFVTGYENIDYLYSLIRHYVYECSLTLDIKQKYKELYYFISDEESEVYYELKEKYLDDDEIEIRNNNIFLEMTNKMQHTYCCSSEKFDLLDNLFEKIPEYKTIIFCKYIDSRLECGRRYPDAKVLSYQSDAYGLNLQEYRYTVYFDKIWDYALRTQSGCRTFRTGQEYDCEYYDLTGNVGLERLINLNITKKVSMVDYFKSKTKEELRKEL